MTIYIKLAIFVNYIQNNLYKLHFQQIIEL